MMTALDREEIPPPSPSSWRPLGSGLPSAASRIASRAGPGAGRSRSWKTRQRLVPPRMYTAGIFRCAIVATSLARLVAWVARLGSGPAPCQREDAASQENVALARGEDA